jgi:hypothetical protein
MNANDDRGRRGPPEYPRSEPEIIPPERHEAGRDPNSHVWIWVADQDGLRRASIRTPGPLTIMLVLALIALVAAAVLVIVLSAVLFWIPVIVVVIAALLLTASAQQYWWRFRSWLSRR